MQHHEWCFGLMRQVCAQWVSSKMYECTRCRLDVLASRWKYCQSLCRLTQFFAIETNRLTRVSGAGLLVVKCQCQKEALQSATHHTRARKIWISAICTRTERVNIWKEEMKIASSKTFGCAHLGAPLIFGIPIVNSDLNLFMKGFLEARRVWSRCEIYDSTVLKLLGTSWDTSGIP